MFLDFFYYLRDQGLKISMSEWLLLEEGMEKGLHGSSLEGFYHLCRAIILRNEADFDLFDQAFLKYFENLPSIELLPVELQEIYAKEMEKAETAENVSAEDMMVSTDSMTGEAGEGKNAPGPGSGSKGGRTSIFAPGSRKFRDFRKDHVLDTRQFQMAFRILRNLSSQYETSEQELDIDRTIHETCSKGGLLHVEYRKPRRNTIRVILLIDSGGSMSGYERLCSELFQAATASKHLKELRTYFFHNIPYSVLYKEPTLAMTEGNGITIDQLLADCNEKYRVIIVGDAEMNPFEFEGSEYNWIEKKNGSTGVETLKRLKRHYPHLIWLNPSPMAANSNGLIGGIWEDTHREIADMVDMYDLTLDGLERGFRYLLSGKK